MNNFIKNKKLIGTLALLLIIIISTIIIYQKQGNKKLNKNDTEEIFVSESENEADVETNGESKNEDKVKESDSSNKKTANTIKANKSAQVQKIVVEIKGEVNKPDVYTLDKNSIVKDLIDMAGGLTSDADLGNINRAKQLTDHELIYIGNKNEQASSNISSSTSNIESNKNSNNNLSNNDLININTASLDELKKINGIGDAKAKTIIEYRETNGNFNSIEDIKNVSGIGEKMFEKIKQQITT